MRFSPRRVVKYATFLLLFAVLNACITYSVTLWTFAELGENNKVVKSSKLRGKFHGVDDHGYSIDATSEEGNEVISRQDFVKSPSIFRNQRSAKAVLSDDEFMRSVGDENDASHQKPAQQVFQTQTGIVTHKESKQEWRRGSHSKNSRKLNRLGKTKDAQDAKKITDVEDVFFSVKTTLKYHKSRVKLLLKTWYRLASDQTFFFTDGDDNELSEILGNHLINTNCSTDHSRRALSCKMAVEFDYYLASRKRWFCHVDDDVYVNIPQLINLLQKYNHKEDWYLGKPSLRHPLEVMDRENPGMRLTFWFATGGAGFCISRSLALKMSPYAGGGRFVTTAEQIRLPDDCTLGYIIEYLLRKKLTVINEFHSHLEALSLLKLNAFKDQITFSFSDYSNKKNVIHVPGFNMREDPTRLKSLHCFLFPTFRECKSLEV